ncbi:hypothetical protein MLD38_029230 [Melastoma candidum]|uniref:Uncharacterized protein n=1 Tax=Melastoma candidum TaxID=119954 RepID=A0ACB9N3G4_9MYRT|nr:hypothetical protein MLD38_029230 [Melastoma candidum]
MILSWMVNPETKDRALSSEVTEAEESVVCWDQKDWDCYILNFQQPPHGGYSSEKSQTFPDAVRYYSLIYVQEEKEKEKENESRNG